MKNHFCAVAAGYLKASFCNTQGEAIAPVEKTFVDHLAHHGKSFPTKEEYNFRLETFKANDEKINASNANPKNTFTLAHNHLSTVTKEEYAKMHTYKKSSGRRLRGNKNATRKLQAVSAGPKDWRDPAGDSTVASVVGPVRDQSGCDDGYCRGFAEISALESAAQIYATAIDSAYAFTELSNQQFIDCISSDSSEDSGSDSGSGSDSDSDAEEVDPTPPPPPQPITIGKGFAYAAENQIQTAAVYEARDGWYSGRCRTKTEEIRDSTILTPGFLTAGAVTNVTPNSVDDLKVAIEQQPVVVAVRAADEVFQFYKTGIINSADCGTIADHSILAVGWANDAISGNDYYIAKNSYGDSWGLSGYVHIQVEAGTAGICGIQSDPIWAPVTFVTEPVAPTV